VVAEHDGDTVNRRRADHCHHIVTAKRWWWVVVGGQRVTLPPPCMNGVGEVATESENFKVDHFFCPHETGQNG
jgi:hypothetical protein